MALQEHPSARVSESLSLLLDTLLEIRAERLNPEDSAVTRAIEDAESVLDEW